MTAWEGFECPDPLRVLNRLATAMVCVWRSAWVGWVGKVVALDTDSVAAACQFVRLRAKTWLWRKQSLLHQASMLLHEHDVTVFVFGCLVNYSLRIHIAVLILNAIAT